MFKPMKVSPTLEQVIQSTKTLESVYSPLKETKRLLEEGSSGEELKLQNLSQALDDLEASMGKYQQVLIGQIEELTGNSNLTVCNFDDMTAALEREKQAREAASADMQARLEKTEADMQALREELSGGGEQGKKAMAELKSLRSDLASETSERSRGDNESKRYAREQGGRAFPLAVVTFILTLGALAAALTGTTYVQIIDFFKNLFG